MPSIEWVQFQAEMKRQLKYRADFERVTGERMPMLDDWAAWLRLAARYGYPDYPSNISPTAVFSWIMGTANKPATTATTARVSREEARKRAEAHVGRFGWSSRNALAKICECSPNTIGKAIDASQELQRAEAAYKLQTPNKKIERGPEWSMVVDEALRQLVETAPASKRAELQTPAMRTHLENMSPEDLAELVETCARTGAHGSATCNRRKDNDLD